MTESPKRQKKSDVVLVTGGAGLVGRAIKQCVEDQGLDKINTYVWLSSKDGDLRSKADTEAIFSKYEPTKVIHLAARVGGLFANMADNLGFFEDNMNMNNNVISCCHERKITDVIFCLSTCVFPADATLPFTEESIHLGPPHPSNEGYAHAKRMAECQVRYYRGAHSYNWCCIVPTNVYGPHDNFHLEKAHVIPALIHKCWLAKENKTTFTIAGTGTPLRQFIYSLDLGSIILKILDTIASAPASVILCPDEGDEPSIKEVGFGIVKAVGFDGEVKFDTTKSDGIHRKTASNGKLRRLLPDFKFTPMEEGLKKSVDWFLENKDQARV